MPRPDIIVELKDGRVMPLKDFLKEAWEEVWSKENVEELKKLYDEEPPDASPT